jgi:hypothetical protein
VQDAVNFMAMSKSGSFEIAHAAQMNEKNDCSENKNKCQDPGKQSFHNMSSIII